MSGSLLSYINDLWGELLNKGDIEKYLGMVGVELEKKGLTARILLLGGAAMLIGVGSRRGTQDVDAYFESNYDAISEAGAIVAHREGLPPEWLNDDAAIVVHQVKPPKSQRLWKKFGGLYVHIPSLDYMLALKLHAGRVKDYADIRILAKKLKITAKEEAFTILKHYKSEDHKKGESLEAINRCFKS